MGVKEEIYTFDSDKAPSAEPVSVVTSDTRVLADVQDELVDFIRLQRKRYLAMTDEEAMEDTELGIKDKPLKDHREKVRYVCNVSLVAIKAAATLAELDAIPWSEDLANLVEAEFPDSLGAKDPSKKPKQTESKSSQGDKPVMPPKSLPPR